VFLSWYGEVIVGDPVKSEILIVPDVELPSGWMRLPEGEKKEISGVL
jgi:hypothetical protein